MRHAIARPNCNVNKYARSVGAPPLAGKTAGGGEDFIRGERCPRPRLFSRPWKAVNALIHYPRSRRSAGSYAPRRSPTHGREEDGARGDRATIYAAAIDWLRHASRFDPRTNALDFRDRYGRRERRGFRARYSRGGRFRARAPRTRVAGKRTLLLPVPPVTVASPALLSASTSLLCRSIAHAGRRDDATLPHLLRRRSMPTESREQLREPDSRSLESPLRVPACGRGVSPFFLRPIVPVGMADPEAREHETRARADAGAPDVRDAPSRTAFGTP